MRHTPSNSLGKASFRSSSDEFSGDAIGEPLFSTPSSATSLGSDGGMEGLTRVRTVLRHGEVQTSSGVFRKKKEYLVLTDTHVIRYKSQAKAADAFKGGVPYPSSRQSGAKHGAMPSVGSYSDLQTLSDSSGDRTGRVPLRQVVAVYRLDDGKPYFAVELCYLDEDSSQASAVTLQFNNPEERDIWLRAIRAASYDARLREQSHISPSNLETVARIVERDNDYDPSNCAIYKIVQQHTSPKTSRSSADDLTKVASIICFLAIGVHKVHVVQIMKSSGGRSSPSVASPNSQVSYGVVNLSTVRVNDSDDSFELVFRKPLQPAKHLHLASTQSYEIAARLHYAEGFLRPECGHRLLKFNAPKEVDRMLAVPAAPSQEHCSFDRTLSAYCIAYGISPSTVRYAINYECEDAPRFELLPPADSRRPDYSALALLAIMRALRYNESFGGFSFAGINLNSLNGVHDTHGYEYVCTRTKRGTAVRISEDEINRSCLLVQEVQALAACSKKLRRMDFSGCVTALSADQTDTADEETKPRDIGCGLVQALAPLCRHQTTNVDWICLNGIQLTDTDMDYLVSAAVDKSCHFRAIEMNRCGLGDRNIGLILDALRAHENTLESVQIAGNAARIDPSLFDSQLSVFGFIRKLNLSNTARTSGSEPLLTAETLLIWRLQELRLSGTSLNSASIDAVATYLAHPQSRTLHELSVDNAYLSGSDVATLLHSLAQDSDRTRDLHLDISHNILTKGLEEVTKAIAEGMAPSHLSMRAIEYREESQFRRMVNALTANKTIRFLDMSQTALPGDATDETCRALSRMLSDNSTLRELDWSGEVSRLASSKFGPGINDALMGLKQNKALITFRVEKQKLGLQGASTLAEVLKENTTLRELHCANNEIPLHGLTDLVNSLINNTTLLYLPTMSDGREAAFRTAELTMKGMSDPEPPPLSSGMRSATFSATSGVRRGLQSVRKSAARAAFNTPSFPALSSASRAGSPPQPGGPSSPVSFHRPRARTNSLTTVSSPLSFTIQDIQTTHRLLSEQWDRQCYRLTKYLERNWNMMNDVPVDLEVHDEKFERPESAGSLGKVLEQVKFDTTPRHEKDVYFDSPQDNPPQSNVDLLNTEMVEGEKHSLSFKRFVLDSGPQTPDSVDGLTEKSSQLRINTTMEQLDEPRTPTQNYFTA